MNATGKRRLLKLADLLETVPRKKFKLTHWTEGRSSDPRECGTVGCAVGWATTIRSFKKAGLKVTRSTVEGYDDRGRTLYAGRLHYGSAENWDAVTTFFDIDKGAARRVFEESQYLPSQRTPRHVAKRIRKLTASKAE